MLTLYHQIKYKGSLLLNTLWILFILSLLAFALAWRMSLEIKMTKHALYQLKDLYAAKSGLIRAMEVTRKDSKSTDSFRDKWANNPALFKNVKVGDSSFTISYVYDYEPVSQEPVVYYGMIDEQRKINLNMDDLGKLESALNNLKAVLAREGPEEPLLTADIVDSILDWRDNDSEVRPQGAEADFYKERGYVCRNGKFSVMEELLLVKGMDQKKFKELSKHLTIYGKSDGKINVNTAGKEVLAAVVASSIGSSTPEEALSVADSIITRRQGESVYQTEDDDVFDNIEEISDFMPADNKEAVFNNLQNWLRVNSDYFLVNIEGRINMTIIKRAEAVYERNRNEIVYWHED